MLARSKLNSIETLYLKHLWILTLVMKNTRLLLTKKRITEHLKKENIRNLKNDELNEEAKKKRKCMSLFSCISFLQKHTKTDVCVIKNFRGDNVIDIVLVIKAYDLQMKLGIKNISDLVRKKIMGRCGTKEPTEQEYSHYKTYKK